MNIPMLELDNMCKYFSRVVANDNVCLKIYPGEIHALLGENGSGKTTLMNCVYGLYTQDEGRIIWQGKELKDNSILTAINNGIGMVHQHFMLVHNLTVLENIILGLPSNGEFFINNKKASEKVRAVLEEYKLNIDLEAKIWDLPVGLQQWVEIIKVLCLDVKLLILDEPTASLTPEDVKGLFKFLEVFASKGNSVILITHKLEEVLRVSNRVTVLRDGKLIKTLYTAEVDKQVLVDLMVGKEIKIAEKKELNKNNEVVLEVKDLEANKNNGMKALKGVSFNVRSGEVLGIAGVAGNGQTELAEVLCGLRSALGGTVHLKGRDITNYSPRQLTELNVAHIPEDRHHRGLVLDFSIKENAILGLYYRIPYSSGVKLNHNYINSNTERLIKEYSIKTPDIFTKIRLLSGGNQQKLILSRELSKNPDFIILAQPTRGLDIGAAEFVRKEILKQRERGAAIIYISGEIEEIFNISDKVAVFFEGEIVGLKNIQDIDQKTVGLMMAGSYNLNESKAHSKSSFLYERKGVSRI
ncbi:MAG: ABC transporter ATP-binding protein [Clostridia bacterium]|nr:ABC transporter ATP-binding protein [Clostridia bacterium]